MGECFADVCRDEPRAIVPLDRSDWVVVELELEHEALRAAGFVGAVGIVCHGFLFLLK
jgi:hypothetical protein